MSRVGDRNNLNKANKNEDQRVLQEHYNTRRTTCEEERYINIKLHYNDLKEGRYQ